MTTTLRPRPGVFWLEEAMDADERPCPPLVTSVTADVCVVGGGYTGLWCALELAISHPDSSVVLIEAQGCGFGASGRNGGWVTGWHDELDNLVEHYGVTDALWLAAEAARAISRIGELAGEWGIDCHFRQRGALWAAVCDAQMGAWDAAVAACQTSASPTRCSTAAATSSAARSTQAGRLDALVDVVSMADLLHAPACHGFRLGTDAGRTPSFQVRGRRLGHGMHL